ncbi:MAG: hypothetical protein H6918_07430 [Sphingomonadaceae bacterium]|nr:hypothetical protein [Sphingomonadaceae bacterium]
MISWIIDTLVWTAALIALVLVLRRPVTRCFGPGAAYALWLLPMLRLVLPPLVLPAWLAPASSPAGAVVVTVVEEGAPAATVPTLASETGLSWEPLVPVLVVLWLAGVVVFLSHRFAGYFRMRRELLADARPVGEAGKVRLVETPATNAPIAFGVLDKVIALPPGFLALHDRTQRDFALAHEFAHHSRHDLLANMLVQPLFALHWFNPLAWYGWHALRRDQEAACDACVVAKRSSSDRAAYASVIAGFAAGPNVALAAPMACPVLGEKSIIHRLRSLTMSDISPRRRFAGKALLAGAVIALPLTASISYAEDAAPVAPLAPSAPAVPAAPAAPQPPAAPVAPALWTQVAAEAPEDGEKRVVVIKVEDQQDDGADEKRMDRREHRIVLKNGEKLSAEQRAELEKEYGIDIDAIEKDAKAEAKMAQREVRVARMEFRGKDGAKPIKIMVRCESDGDDMVNEWVDEDGNKHIAICKTQVAAQALAGLKEARKAIANDLKLEADVRAKALQAIDEKIAEFSKEG